MTFIRRAGIGFVWRFATAAMLSGLAYWLALSPAAPRLLGVRFGVAAWRVVEAPISLLNQVLPEWSRTVVTSKGSRWIVPVPREMEFLRYMAIGLAAYLVLLYLPTLIARLEEMR